jgi:uncharacterized SAM-binding protein YcdF (DUF218 family)
MTERILLSLFLLPLPLMVLLRYGRQRVPKWMLILACAPLLSFYTPFTQGMNALLELPYEQGKPAGEAQAIVIFSGKVMHPEPERPVPVVGEDTYVRAFYAAWLYKNWRALPILVCGGLDRDGNGNPISFAQTVRQVLVNEGIPGDTIWTEDHSETTFENALYGADILRARKIQKVALVTEAYHMLRAERCLRKQGIEVIPAPCNFRSRFRVRPEHLVGARREAFNWSVDAAHEFGGLAWYWLRGRI